MKAKAITLLLGVLVLSFGAKRVMGHCEIPCGIYNDEVRANLIEEHAGTIEKSMKTIVSLQNAAETDYNQLVRWIANKDDHANKIQDIVTQYFMTQRIKTDTADYSAKIRALHEMLIYAMKCKQTTDTQNVAKLRQSLDTFRRLYFSKSKHTHSTQKKKLNQKK